MGSLVAPIAISLVFLHLPAAGAAPAAAPRSDDHLAESTSVTLVEVPVQVMRDGQPVRGLKASDFEIVEGRQTRPITGFDVVDLAAPENRLLSADIPAAGKRHFLLLFDLANSKPKTIARARAAILESLLKTLTPSDLTAVAVYSPQSGLRLIQGFTSDLRQVARAVIDLGIGLVDSHPATDQTAGDASALGQAMQMLDNLYQRMQEPPPTFAGETAYQAGQADVHEMIGRALVEAFQTEVNQEAAEIAQYQHDEIAQAKSSVAPLTMAFADLARMMDAVSGRKFVVLFSEGFDTTVLSGDESAENQALTAQAVETGNTLSIDTDERYGSTRQANMMEKMLEQFRRSDCVIEAVDIFGLRGMDLAANTQHGGESSLVLMARDTGGEVFRNTNDLGRALDELVRRTSLTYVLSFQPERLKQDGSYHPIKVRLKDAPRGTQLTYRQGYYAPVPFGQRKPLEKMLAATDQLMGANDGGSITAAVLAEPFRGAPPAATPASSPPTPATAAQGAVTAGRAYVPVVVEMDGKGLLDGLAGKVLPTEIYAYAVDASGAIADFFHQTLQLDLDKARPLLLRSGLKYFGHLELPAGDYALRVLVRNGSTGAFAKRTVLVKVPAFDARQAVLLPPLFPEDGSRWALVHETPRGAQKDAAYPFVVGTQAYVPASRPVLHPGEEAPLSVLGYNLDGALKTVAHVQSADGRDLGECPLHLGALVPGAAGQADVYKASFRLPASLPPGSYRLVITGTGGGGSGGEVSATSPFAVTSPGERP